jgi:nicotinamidase-related amidase
MRVEFMKPDTKPDNGMAGTRKAMIRAARRAAEIARQHNQPILLWQDGRVVEVMPDDLPPLPDEAPRKHRS